MNCPKIISLFLFLLLAYQASSQYSRQIYAADYNVDCYEIDDERFYLQVDVTRLGSSSVTEEGECFVFDGPLSSMFMSFWVGEIELLTAPMLQYFEEFREYTEFETDCLTPIIADTCLYYNSLIDSTGNIHDERDRRMHLLAKEIHAPNYVNLESENNWQYVDTFQLLRKAILNLNRTARMDYLMTTHQYPVDVETFIALKAMDADGDSLVYRLAPPHGKPTSITVVFPTIDASDILDFPYAPGFSALEPMGPGGLIIDNLNNQLLLNPSQVGKYFIHMIVEEYRNGQLLCAKPFFFPIWIIDNSPKVEASVQADEYQEELAIINLCEFSEYTFLNNSSVQNDIDFFYWVINGDTLTDWSPTYAFDSPGIFDAELFIEDVEGCSDAQLITINVGEPITASYSAAPATAIYAGEALQFTNTSTGSFNHSHWQISNGQSFTSENLTHTFSEPGIFEISLTIENEIGCQKTYAQSFEFKTPDGFYFPNVFSPNEDGANDEFRPYGNFDFIKDYEMKIFDRWGALLFQSNDPLLGWNGNSRDSKKALSGIYVFQIQYLDANDKLQTKVGDILLL